jgi:hypothetical protein
MGLITAVWAVISVRRAFRCGGFYVGEAPAGRTVFRQRNPALFWTAIVTQILAGVIIVAAIVVSAVRALLRQG